MLFKLTFAGCRFLKWQPSLAIRNYIPHSRASFFVCKNITFAQAQPSFCGAHDTFTPSNIFM
jgi:hypothetical protein